MEMPKAMVTIVTTRRDGSPKRDRCPLTEPEAIWSVLACLTASLPPQKSAKNLLRNSLDLIGLGRVCSGLSLLIVVRGPNSLW